MQNLRVLIADDEPIIRMDIKEILLEAGQRVVGEANNGLQALEMARQIQPDMVIMDIKMPKMDGLKAAKLITGEKIAPVILLSALSGQEFVNEAYQTGIISYLLKPIEPKNFIICMQMTYRNYIEINQLKNKVARLNEDLQTRKVVEKAKGLIMEKEGLSEGEAIKRIQGLSMAKGVNIKYIAQKIITVYTGKK